MKKRTDETRTGYVQPGADRCRGVSEVVGEMLMIGLVIMLLAVFTTALYTFVPMDRGPTIAIRMSNDTLGNVTLWHKGGDWVKAEDLNVVILQNGVKRSYRYNRTQTDTGSQFSLVSPDGRVKGVFDLGSAITVTLADPGGNGTVRLVTTRTVIFTGRIGP